MKVGYLGGSFNPIHNAHITLALKAMEECLLDKVIFMPTGINPLKKKNNISPNHRLNMVKAALGKYPFFSVCDYELKSNQICYTIDTINYLQNKFSDLYFIGGADLLFEIDRWKEYDILLKKIPFIIANRPPHTKDKTRERIVFLKDEFNANIHLLKNFEISDISSTDLRSKLNENLIPKETIQYIKDNNLYID